MDKIKNALIKVGSVLATFTLVGIIPSNPAKAEIIYFKYSGLVTSVENGPGLEMNPPGLPLGSFVNGTFYADTSVLTNRNVYGGDAIPIFNFTFNGEVLTSDPYLNTLNPPIVDQGLVGPNNTGAQGWSGDPSIGLVSLAVDGLNPDVFGVYDPLISATNYNGIVSTKGQTVGVPFSIGGAGASGGTVSDISLKISSVVFSQSQKAAFQALADSYKQVADALTLNLPDQPGNPLPIGADQLTSVGGILAAAALIPEFAVIAPALGTAAAIAQLVQWGSQALAWYFQNLANDPPDLSYKTVTLPITPSLPQFPVTTTDPLADTLASTGNALVGNLFQSIGLLQAINTSFNRANTAATFGDGISLDLQYQAIQDYSQKLSVLLRDEPQLLSNFTNAYSLILGTPNITSTPSSIEAAQQSLLTNGLSSDDIQALTALGVDNLGQNQVLQNLLAVNPNEAAALGNGNSFNFLTDPTLITNLNNAAQALNPGQVYIAPQPVPVPTPSYLFGVGTFVLLGIFKLKNLKNKKSKVYKQHL